MIIPYTRPQAIRLLLKQILEYIEDLKKNGFKASFPFGYPSTCYLCRYTKSGSLGRQLTNNIEPFDCKSCPLVKLFGPNDFASGPFCLKWKPGPRFKRDYEYIEKSTYSHTAITTLAYRLAWFKAAYKAIKAFNDKKGWK